MAKDVDSLTVVGEHGGDEGVGFGGVEWVGCVGCAYRVCCVGCVGCESGFSA